MATIFSQIQSTFSSLMGSPTVTRSAIATEVASGWSGQSTLTYANYAALTAVFLDPRFGKEFETEGKIDLADGYLVVAYNTTLNRDDKIKVVISSVTDTYMVNSVVVRGTKYKFARLTRWSKND